MRYIQDPETLKLVTPEEFYKTRPASTFNIIKDIEPFQSLATADRPIIKSRSQLRAYCKENNLIPEAEAGNLPPLRTFNPPDENWNKKDIREALIKEVYHSGKY